MHLKLVIIFLISLIFTFNLNTSFSTNKKTGKVEFGENNISFMIEIADTNKKRRKGLMYKKSLGDNEGMLFIFPSESFISMWMKNTFISLDIIFISKNYQIVDIIENTFPLSKYIYTSKESAKYALEINGGLVERFNIKIGDKIKIDY